MEKKEIYALLEEKLLEPVDYVDVPIQPCNEEMVPILETPHLKICPIDPNMAVYTGDQIYVRQGVLEKLLCASGLLASQNSTMQLEVVYGYRAREIQMALFEKGRAELSKKFSGEDLLRAARRYIAEPEVASHPTGGAVDIQIVKNGKPLDFGTKIWEFVEDAFTCSPFVSKKAWANRHLLRRIMLSVGFAPFDGEWWHFSYGDKEWARYFEKPFAIYEQLDFKLEVTV